MATVEVEVDIKCQVTGEMSYVPKATLPRARNLARQIKSKCEGRGIVCGSDCPVKKLLDSHPA